MTQLEGRDYTEPAFNIEFGVADDRSEVELSYCVGTFSGGCDVIDNEPLGGGSTLIERVGEHILANQGSLRMITSVSVLPPEKNKFKILNGYEDIDSKLFFKLKEDSMTRGHKAALVKPYCRLNKRKFSFSQRTINDWNHLSHDCVNASSVNMFKNIIDNYLARGAIPRLNI